MKLFKRGALRLIRCRKFLRVKDEDNNVFCYRMKRWDRGCPYSVQFGCNSESTCPGLILALRRKHRKMYKHLYKIQKKYQIYDELLHYSNEAKQFYRFRSGEPSRMNHLFIQRGKNLISMFRRELVQVKKKHRKETKGYAETRAALERYQVQKAKNEVHNS